MTADGRIASLGLLAVAAAMMSGPAMGEGSLSWEASVGRQLYGVNLGWMQSIGGDLSHGPVVTASADLTGYQFNSDGVTLRANAPDVAVGAGHAWSGEGWSFEALASVGLLYTFNNPPQGPQPTRQPFLRPEISA